MATHHSVLPEVLPTGVYHRPAQFFIDHFGIDPRKVGLGPFRLWRLAVFSPDPRNPRNWAKERVHYTLEVVTRDLKGRTHQDIVNYMRTLDGDGSRAACATGLFHYGADAITEFPGDERDIQRQCYSRFDDLGTVVYTFDREVNRFTREIDDRV